MTPLETEADPNIRVGPLRWGRPAKAQIPRGEQVYDRSMLAVLTSRAWNRGLALAENAARGQFPSYKRPDYAVVVDPRWLEPVRNGRRLWKKEINREQRQT